MLEKQIDQAERRETLINDAKVREQQNSGTFLSHTHSDLGGRYSGVGAQTIVGAEPTTRYPAASAHQHDPCGTEPPLGYSVSELTPFELEPSMSSHVQAQAPDGPPAPSIARSPSAMSSSGPSSFSRLRRRKL
jgi:hypothetical protein